MQLSIDMKFQLQNNELANRTKVLHHKLQDVDMSVRANVFMDEIILLQDDYLRKYRDIKEGLVTSGKG